MREFGEHIGQRQEAISTVLVDLAQGHRLDQRQVEAVLAAPGEHRRHLVAVQPLQRDHVDLDREPRVAGGEDAGEHRRQIADPGDEAEPIGIAAVQAYVDPPQPGAVERLGMGREPRAVGRHRQLVEPGADMAPQPLGEFHHVAPHQRFAPRKPDLAYPARDEALGDHRDFLQAQQRLARQETHLLRHAIAAAQIAAVRHRDPQIADRAAVSIDQGGACHRGTAKPYAMEPQVNHVRGAHKADFRANRGVGVRTKARYDRA